MKFGDVTFPYPVLGVGDAVKGKFGLNPFPEITSTVESYSITVNCQHDNGDLSALVEAGKAEFLCEATCSNTLYRQIFTSNRNELQFEIQKKQLKGRVLFSCVLVAKEAISDYKNSESHPDYDGFRFEIENG